MKPVLLVIDPQSSFCDVVAADQQHVLHQGELCVPGAAEAMRRLAALVDRLGDSIDDVHITMDSRHLLHISHPLWFKDANGNPPPVFSSIRVEGDQIIGSRIVRGRKPKDIGIFKTFRPSMERRTIEYLAALERLGRYQHTIWPTHCLIGTPGHCVQTDLMQAVISWETRNLAAANYITKGSNFFAEHFSAVAAAVPDPIDPTTFVNTDLLNSLMDADRVLIAGVGRATTVADTLLDSVAHCSGPGLVSKCLLLTDCVSVNDLNSPHLTDTIEKLTKQGLKKASSHELSL